MAYRNDRQFRVANASDAEAIAALHTDSWRRHYRGAYSDSFLDGDVLADRLTVWSNRLRRADDLSRTVVVEDRSGLIAFAHVVFDDDPTWGALLDNLHVTSRHKRRGVGSQLLGSVAQAVIEKGTDLYLWVQEQNVEAQAFYQARGATFVERALISPPGGIASRLNGSPAKLRYVWTDLSATCSDPPARHAQPTGGGWVERSEQHDEGDRHQLGRSSRARRKMMDSWSEADLAKCSNTPSGSPVEVSRSRRPRAAASCRASAGRYR